MGFARKLGGLVLAVAIGVSGVALAEPFGDAGAIVFGQVATLDGPAGDVGRSLRAGLLTAFAEVNAGGGVQGRRLELVSRDDGGDPERTVSEAHRLMEDGRVLALLGTGAVPQDPAAPPMITPHPSFERQAEAWIGRLTADLGARRIAILYEDGAAGRAGLAAVERAMEAHGLPPVARGSYPRNTTAVRAALLAIRKSDPEAVILIAGRSACAEFVRLSERLKLGPVFVVPSVVDARMLAEELGPTGARVAVSRVLPAPDDDTVPLVAAYRKALAKLDPERPLDSVSLEGYALGRLVADALGRMPGEPTRAGLLQAVEEAGRDAGPVGFAVIRPDGRVEAADGLADLKG